MRKQYFKRRKPFDFAKETNDIGRPLFWNKKLEDNHFLYRLYKKDEMDFEAFYNYHLHFFLSKYTDGNEQEFFRYVWEIIQDAIAELRLKDRYNSKHASNFKNKFHLNLFAGYLQSIDQWNFPLAYFRPTSAFIFLLWSLKISISKRDLTDLPMNLSRITSAVMFSSVSVSWRWAS